MLSIERIVKAAWVLAHMGNVQTLVSEDSCGYRHSFQRAYHPLHDRKMQQGRKHYNIKIPASGNLS